MDCQVHLSASGDPVDVHSRFHVHVSRYLYLHVAVEIRVTACVRRLHRRGMSAGLDYAVHNPDLQFVIEFGRHALFLSPVPRGECVAMLSRVALFKFAA